MSAIAHELEPGDWMESVAELVPVPHRGPRPFTLGEAVAELGLWAGSARTESWGNPRNRASLDQDVATGIAAIGPRLRASLSDLLPMLVTDENRSTIASAAADFAERWRQTESVDAAFRDLCEASATGSYGVWDLKPMAEVLASQLGETRRGWNVLSEVSTALAGEPDQFQLKRWLGEEAILDDFTPSVRLATAGKLLRTDPPRGRVVVWLLYRRARVGARVSAGRITFLLADWAIPNATRDNGQDFPERDELRALMTDSLSFKEEELISGDPAGERHVLVRVDLGQRSAASATEEATRRVDALLSIAVEAGGVSWINTGTSATLVGGREQMGTFGTNHGRGGNQFHDSYGINATSELLTSWAGRLHTALSTGPMPDFLVEALASVREASMTEHRDVQFYDARPVTPRVAIALEDHAVELIVSLAQMSRDQLISALVQDEADHQWDQLVVNGLLAPLDRSRLTTELAEQAASLTDLVARIDSSGLRIVSLEKLWEVRDRVRALPVSPAARVTLNCCLAAISSTAAEEAVRERSRRSVDLLRKRHRRVRNAITHGNPVSPAAIDSVRVFSERVTREALAVALHAFATGANIPHCLADRSADRNATRASIAGGISVVDRIAEASAEDTGE